MASNMLTTIFEYLSVPPVMINTSMEKLADKPSQPLPADTTFPLPKFAQAIKDKEGTRIPQTIGHRGYKAKYPENTMKAFIEAVNVGSHALETDVHLTRDGVVVLSHDDTLNRCFGRKEKILEYDWEYISQFETVEEPRQHMPRLEDLLQYLKEPGVENVWILLDIKLDNNPEDIIRLIAETINRISPSTNRPWNERIVIGCWATKYLHLCAHYLPNYPVTHIGFSTPYSNQFFSTPHTSFNFFWPVLAGPVIGSSFIRKAKRLDRPVFTWTVNTESRMLWCIRNGVDGVCTDDPKMFLDLCESERGRGKMMVGKGELGWGEWLEVLRVGVFAVGYSVLMGVRYGGSLSHELVGEKGTGLVEEGEKER